MCQTRRAAPPRPLAAVALLLLGLGAGRVRAEDFWCGDKIIATGMTSGEVRAACGRPTEVRERAVTHQRHYANGYPVDEVLEPAGEWWTYNFGSSRLMQKLLFVDGVLVETTTLSYGYDN